MNKNATAGRTPKGATEVLDDSMENPREMSERNRAPAGAELSQGRRPFRSILAAQCRRRTEIWREKKIFCFKKKKISIKKTLRINQRVRLLWTETKKKMRKKNRRKTTTKITADL